MFSDTFPTEYFSKIEDPLSPPFFNFTPVRANRRVQADQERLK